MILGRKDKKPTLASGDDMPREFVLSRDKGLASQPKDFQWVQTNIPCQFACPARTDIPGYLDAIANGDFEAAYRINLRDNVFPAVLGRVCTRPCEPVCRHGREGLGEPVAICFSKRSSSDFLKRNDPVVLDRVFADTGKSVGVIGGGAAGLAAARELQLWGHRVSVYEKHEKAGGLMTFGIPAFRLPRDVVEREVEQVRLTGVDIQCGVEVGKDIQLTDLLAKHNAVVIACGTLRPNMPDLPGVELSGVSHGLSFLREVNVAGTATVGNSVLVVGGGFTAVDCARAAKRLGAEKVGVMYRRSEEEMYINQNEIAAMKDEGITFEPLVSPVEFSGEDSRLTAVKFVRTRLGEPDTSGRRRPEPIPGSEFGVSADTVLLATGQVQDFSWVDQVTGDAILDGGLLKTGSEAATGHERIFVAGDASTGAGSLIEAIGHAKVCAGKVDAFLMGQNRRAEVVDISDAGDKGRDRKMDLIPRQHMPEISVAERTLTAEVETGFGELAAREEAKRCYLCHYKFEIDNELCIYCDRCLKVKPVEGCIVKVASLEYDDKDRITGYKQSSGTRDYNMLFIDQDQCIRCGACVEVCPVECISVQKVSFKMIPTCS
ncbi:MAG: FAD-dependent oxidoreductase [Verrucomicrobia bacterium]|nr:FAD-dependent oxidoreductase [Verrucomicrobiota bacterium]